MREELNQNPLVQKYKFLILPIAAVLIGIGLIAGVIVPQAINIFKTQQSITEENNKVEQLNKKVVVLQQVEVDKSNYQNYMQTALAAIPVEEDVPDVFGRLDYFLKENGLLLDGISFGTAQKDTKSAKTSELTVKIDITGSPEGLRQFLGRLERSPRLFKVSGMDLIGNRDDRVVSSISLLTFYQPLPATIGKVDQQVALPSESELAVLDTVKSYVDALSSTQAPVDLSAPRGKLDPFQ